MNSLNSYIEHTLLKPTATQEDILELCREAIQYNFYGVCVNSCWVKTAKKELSGSNVKLVSVVGFPLGAASAEAKVFEAKQAIQAGAGEIDMVINLGFLKSGCTEEVRQEIFQIKKAIGSHLLKVIIETCFLTEEEKELACRISERAGADIVKTSTGFGTGGATIKDVKLMRAAVSNKLGIKASGGIKNAEDARNFIQAGATRIGTSSGINIVTGK